MKTLRVILTVIGIVVMSAAIGAAPVEKRSTTKRTAPGESSPRTETEQPTMESQPEAIDDAVVTPVPTDNEAVTAPPQDPVAPTSSPAAATAAPVNMDWYSINNGGAIEVAAGNIKMGLSIGQNAVGEVSAGNIKLGLGFWYGAAGSSAPTCACDCAHDPVCDGVTDIFDVAQCVNVAFRNNPDIGDPNILCPWNTTDVNCDDVTDIFDVALMVNVAFRNADPQTEFCDPCAPVL